jgi:hypothetical protein
MSSDRPQTIKSSGKIQYCKGYKYQLNSDWWVETPIRGVAASIPRYAELAPTGILTVHAGYAWDGPSGPTIDTPDFMRGSLAHDVLYQMMREGDLDISYRETADKLLEALCIEDGMTELRAGYVYAAVREFAAPAARRQDRKIFEAP